jgi:glycosyltransferase involved in cell wall biosynthesis
MSTNIVLPVRDQLAMTESICNQLMKQPGWEKAWIFDNGSVDSTPDYLKALRLQDDRFVPIYSSAGIYEMWNLGLLLACEADYVAIINNDLELSPGLIAAMSLSLDNNPQIGLVYPDYDLAVADGSFPIGLRYTAGTYRHGGMSGFCFMLRNAAVDWAPLVDPQFQWWGGDDDIAFNLEARGWLQARLEGFPVDHLNEGTARHHDLSAMKAADMARIIEKWGR